MVNVAVWRVSILFLKHLGKMTAFRNLKLKTAALRKAGSSFLLRHIVTIRMMIGVCPPIHVCSGYLESLFVRKRKEFRRSRANKFLRKTWSAKRKVQYHGSLQGDRRKRETKK